jgi:hypothetical protein
LADFLVLVLAANAHEKAKKTQEIFSRKGAKKKRDRITRRCEALWYSRELWRSGAGLTGFNSHQKAHKAQKNQTQIYTDKN